MPHPVHSSHWAYQAGMARGCYSSVVCKGKLFIHPCTYKTFLPDESLIRVEDPEWEAFCLGRRMWWKGDTIKICRNWWGWCDFWKLGTSSDLWCLSAEPGFSFTEGKCWSFFARRTQRAACADQRMWWHDSSSGLKTTNKSFLSWTISLRYAKAKGWIAFLSRLDFVLGPVCSVHI